MPQVQSVQKKRLYLQPYGKGSLRSGLIDVTFKMHQRVNKVNEGAGSRLKVVTDFMDRNQGVEQTRMTRTIQRMKEGLEKFKAYQKVLDEYKINKLRTLEHGYDKRAIMTPVTDRRCKAESRLYWAGFSMHALGDDIDEMLERIKPKNSRREKQKKLLTVCKRRSEFVIDRKVTNDALRREQLEAISKEQQRASPKKADTEKPQPTDENANQLIDKATPLPPLQKVKFEDKTRFPVTRFSKASPTDYS